MANPAITVMQLELALNNMQNTMVKEDGTLALDDKFFKMFDELMIKLKETREIAESIREK
ncbi:MAG: hypothetical protein QM497_02615 [Sulfurimonas sp.]